jgi:hypothetical protein
MAASLNAGLRGLDWTLPGGLVVARVLVGAGAERLGGAAVSVGRTGGRLVFSAWLAMDARLSSVRMSVRKSRGGQG